MFVQAAVGASDSHSVRPPTACCRFLYMRCGQRTVQHAVYEL